ncbi:MAG: hypothetical protein ACJZ2B_07220 [Candidatus Neomarinimicrobiota bacterium]
MFTSIVLSLTLMCGGIYHEHHEHHNVHDENGYGLCDINCSEKDHKINHHECVKCFNENSSYVVLDLNNGNLHSTYTLLYPTDEHIQKTNSNFDLYCRPPPIHS